MIDLPAGAKPWLQPVLGGPGAGSSEFNEFDGIVHIAFFVDPTPQQGPEEHAFLVVYRTGYSE